jgi:hypothetical protein
MIDQKKLEQRFTMIRNGSEYPIACYNGNHYYIADRLRCDQPFEKCNGKHLDFGYEPQEPQKVVNHWECPFEGIRSYPDCFQDCPDTEQCKESLNWSKENNRNFGSHSQPSTSEELPTDKEKIIGTISLADMERTIVAAEQAIRQEVYKEIIAEMESRYYPLKGEVKQCDDCVAFILEVIRAKSKSPKETE